jgi:hypothetical protein
MKQTEKSFDSIFFLDDILSNTQSNEHQGNFTNYNFRHLLFLSFF